MATTNQNRIRSVLERIRNRSRNNPMKRRGGGTADRMLNQQKANKKKTAGGKGG